MKFIYSILISCLLFIGQAQAANFNLLDATSFDPQPVIVSAADNSVPVGTVIIWTKEVIPDGWLECNGQKVNEVLYPELHKLMQNTPNYNGRFLQGTDTTTKVGDRLEAGLPNITGYLNYFFGTGTVDPGRTWGNGAIRTGKYKNHGKAGDDDQGSYNLTFNASWSNAIYGRSNTVQPPAVVVKYIIKAE